MFTKNIMTAIDQQTADELAERRASTGVPTSEFVRRAIRERLAKKDEQPTLESSDDE